MKYQVKVTRPAPSMWQDTVRFEAATYQEAVERTRAIYQEFHRHTVLYHDPGTYFWFSVDAAGQEVDRNISFKAA